MTVRAHGENEYFRQARICQCNSGSWILVFFCRWSKALLYLPLRVLPVSAFPLSPCPPALFYLHSNTFCAPKYGREILRNLGRGSARFATHMADLEF